MKKTTFVIFAVIIAFAILTVVPFRCNRENVADRYSEMTGDDDSDTVTAIGEPEDNEDLQSEVEFLGDPITEYGNIKVYADWSHIKEYYHFGDDMYAKDDCFLFRYVDDVAKDTMVLNGPVNRLIGDGPRCRIVVGVDTVDIDVRQSFSKSLDIRYADAIPGCRRYRLSRHYALNDSARATDFQINVAMRDSTPLFIRDFISNSIRDDVVFFFEKWDGYKLLKPKIPRLKMKERSMEQMMQHYYSHFRRLYKDQFTPEPDSEDWTMGEWYSYQFYAYPVWESKDSTLTTWKFYQFDYMGGAHGGDTEFFLTFENETGRVLGIRDFFTKDSFSKAIKTLTQQLNEFHKNEYGADGGMTAELDYGPETTSQGDPISEVYRGKIYPRPAMTRNGIVFSYQPYEKGSFADGILRFTQPYNWK